MELAKAEGVPVILVGHVTKDGTLAGPKTLEHLVDVVLSVEGDRTGGLRLLRAAKNRYGSTEEVGVFEMGERGLAEVADPARAFLADHESPRRPGSVVAPVLEGSRPILVEVQALVAPTGAPSPRRTASGVDPNRLALLVAVLGRRAGHRAGGPRRVREPRRRPDRDASPASTCRSRSRSHRRCATGRSSPGPSRSARSGLLGELRLGGRPRPAPARGGATRASRGRSCRARAAASMPVDPGHRDRRRRHARRCGPGGARDVPAARGRPAP